MFFDAIIKPIRNKVIIIASNNLKIMVFFKYNGFDFDFFISYNVLYIGK